MVFFAGNVLLTNVEMNALQLERLLVHTMKIVNIYYHLFTNQKPLLFGKAQKSDLFTNARELAIVQSMGYFGAENVYIKFYNTLKSASDSYKVSSYISCVLKTVEFLFTNIRL